VVAGGWMVLREDLSSDGLMLALGLTLLSTAYSTKPPLPIAMFFAR